MIAELAIGLKGQEPLRFRPQPMTVVVGPNGAGKSTLLRELEAWFKKPAEGHFVRAVDLDISRGGGLRARNVVVEAARKGTAFLVSLGDRFGLQIDPEKVGNVILAIAEQIPDLMDEEDPTEGTSAIGLFGRALVKDARVDDRVLDYIAPLAKNWVANSLTHSPLLALLRTPQVFQATLQKFEAELKDRFARLGLGPTDPSVVEVNDEGEAAVTEAPAMADEHQEADGDDGPPERPYRIEDLVAEAATAALDTGLIDPRRLFESVRNLVVRLDGTERLKALDARRLMDHSEVFERIRALALRHFHLYLGLDVTPLLEASMGGFLGPGPRVAVAPEEASAHELSLRPAARDFFARAKPLEEEGDGVRAFLSLITASALHKEGLVLIDEPEAFLHPPLAAELAHHLAEEAEGSGATCVCATQSAAFLAGCIDSGKAINIVRIGFDRRPVRRSLHVMPAAELKTLLDDPVVRSAGVLEALFAESAVLCEGETDCLVFRTAYRAVAGHRMNCTPVFISLGTKSKIPFVLGPLRKMGVRVAALVDFDFLYGQKQGKNTDFTQLMNALDLTPGMRRSAVALKDAVKDQATPEAAKAKGLGAYEPPDDARKLLSDLAAQGVFVLPWGELESQHPFARSIKLPSVKDKTGWAGAVASHLAKGESPSAGLREFIHQLAAWLHPQPEEAEVLGEGQR